ncbi:MAG: TetR/AcrR family transcriptional regulator [Christensenellaceae bacterium]|jgi:AcrR family transcriptional regulator
MPKIIENVSGKIIDATVEIYLRDGYDAISIRKISAKSGVSIGTVYTHFEDKETLIAHILSGGLEQLKNAMMEQVFQKEPRQALYGAVHAFISMAAGEKNNIIRFALDLQEKKDYIARALKGATGQIKELLYEVVLQLFEACHAPPDCRLLSEMIYAMMTSAAQADPGVPEARATMICDIVFSYADGLEKAEEKRCSGS